MQFILWKCFFPWTTWNSSTTALFIHTSVTALCCRVQHLGADSASLKLAQINALETYVIRNIMNILVRCLKSWTYWNFRIFRGSNWEHLCILLYIVNFYHPWWPYSHKTLISMGIKCGKAISHMLNTDKTKTKLWNELPMSTKSVNWIHVFKSRLKRNLMEHY